MSSRIAIVTVGLGFGDEGKGTITEYLCHKYGADQVTRYSGGYQAGHTVVLSDGRRHRFSQWGCGTFQNVKTFLDRDVIISPSAMKMEAESLIKNGLVDPYELLKVHPNCLVATPYHVAMNRIQARLNGHGSCGMGIGTTREYYLEHGNDAITFEDVKELGVLEDKMILLAKRYKEKIKDFPIMDSNEIDFIIDANPRAVARNISLDATPVQIGWGDSYNTCIFEGSQGILLDETCGFHPHTTWGDVTTKNALDSLRPGDKYTTVGITRTYLTRHGNGPFPTYSDDFYIHDDANEENPWQGSMKCGALDMILLQYAKKKQYVDSIALTHYDRFLTEPTKVCLGYNGTPTVKVCTNELFRAKPHYTTMMSHEIVDILNDHIAPVRITSSGRTLEDKMSLSDLQFKEYDIV